jgi:three-Cys-motif partner protein
MPMSERLEVVGYWTEIKLNIVKEYANAYSKIMSKQGHIRYYAYIDAFAGAGTLKSKESGEEIDGSTSMMLKIQPGFSHYHLIEMNPQRAERLRQLTNERDDVTIYEGDSNTVLINEVFPDCRYENFRRALCLLDPYELNPKWEVASTAGHMKSIDIFLNFMIMDANRNVLWSNPDTVPSAQIERMNEFWGDDSWREIAYKLRPGLFGNMREKATNQDIIRAYQDRLKDVAGFKYVPDPIPMRNSRGVAIYYLFFASHNETGAKIARSIFKKYRDFGF